MLLQLVDLSILTLLIMSFHSLYHVLSLSLPCPFTLFIMSFHSLYHVLSLSLYSNARQLSLLDMYFIRTILLLASLSNMLILVGSLFPQED
jgi:hypothetical protein